MNTITGIYSGQVFKNQYSGFTIFKIKPSDIKEYSQYMKNGCIVCKGIIPTINDETPLQLMGDWEQTDYGWNFNVKDFNESSYDKYVTTTYLKSLPGIGDQRAEIIANKYDDVFSMAKRQGIEHQLALLMKCSLKTAKDLVKELRKTSVKKEAMQYLLKKGVSMYSIDKLFKKFDINGLTMLKKDPYKIGECINMSLESMDKIAEDMNTSPLSKDRIVAYIKNCMEKTKMQGNIFEEERDLYPVVYNSLNKSMLTKISKSFFTQVIKENPIFQLEEKEINEVSLTYLDKAETNLATQIVRLQTNAKQTKFEEHYLYSAEKEIGITLAPEQRGAFDLLRQTGIGILTGGPGTGKTTTVNGIITAYELMYPNNKVKLCAPTGRAAQRMTESTGREASTIHRLIEYKPFEGSSTGQCKDQYNPIDADFIVVDEVSMLDTELASLFLTAVKTGTLVLFVGDINQLQSVGPGDVLNDLINSGYVPVKRLIKTYRQAETSTIIKNAKLINDGYTSLIKADDFEIHIVDDITKTVCDIVKDYYKSEDQYYIQVLSPTHKGDGGEIEINKCLQDQENPGKNQLNYGAVGFRRNDKIIMINNNLEKGYFNGDVGIVKDFTDNGMLVDIRGSNILLSQDSLEDVKLAYSMTIHKSQGSEFPVVVVALPYSGMLKRNLLYTAVTRAKKKVIIVSQRGAISQAIKTNEVGKRKTNLIKKIDIRRNADNED